MTQLPAAAWQTRLDAARTHYIGGGTDINSPWRFDEAALMRSWQRCRAIGLGVTRPVMTRADPCAHEAGPPRHTLHASAVARVAHQLAASVNASGAVVVVTNTAATVIHACGDAGHLPPTWRALMQTGTSLAEHRVGTTAPALALLERHPQIVIRDAHYCRSLQSFYCAAVPIADPSGGLLGTIDLSAYGVVPRIDALGLLRLAADRIEDEVLAGRAEAGVLHLVPPVGLHYAMRPGLVAVDRLGRACAINRVAAGWLGAQATQGLPRPLSQLLGSAVGHIERHPSRPARSVVDLCLPSGLVLMANYELGPAIDVPNEAIQPPRTCAQVKGDVMRSALDACGGNLSAAARTLGVSRNTLYRWLATQHPPHGRPAESA